MQKSSTPPRTFLVLSILAAAFAMLQTLVGPVLPVIEKEFSSPPGAVAWILISWLLSAAVATPILGRVGDMIGKKRTLLVGLAAIVAGSVIAALAPNLGLVLLGRVLQGLGGAIFPLSFGLLREAFPPERLPSAVGMFSSVVAVGGGLGSVFAGPIVDLMGWRGLFWIPALVVTLTAFVAHRLIPESRTLAPGRINGLSAVLLCVWLIALLLPVSQGAAWGWTSAGVLALFAVAVLGFLGWLHTESRAQTPLIDLQMMRLPGVWTTNLVACLFGAALYPFSAFLPLFVQMPHSTGYGFEAGVTGAGLVMLPLLVTMALSGVVSGNLSRSMGFKLQIGLGSALALLSCLGLAFEHQALWQLALASGVFGLGVGLAYTASSSLIVQNVLPTQTGAASGMNANIRNIGGAIGTAVISTIITSQVHAGGHPTEAMFTLGFVTMAALALLATGVSFLIPGAGPIPGVVSGQKAEANS